ncbi:hypothetical protein [Staphylococcus americanisciuri]|nr:hypothetical protein [Staphylococcus americanisciuri]
MPGDIHLDADVALFWMNIVMIVFGVFLVFFQSIIYKFIVGFIGVQRSFSIGFNLFLFTLSILPSSIVIALVTYLNNGISVSQNIWINMFSMLISAVLYGMLLVFYSIIEKRKALIIVLIVILLNTIINMLKFF